MNETAFETIASAASVLKLDFSSEEFAGFVEDYGLSEDAIEAVKKRSISSSCIGLMKLFNFSAFAFVVVMAVTLWCLRQ